MPGDNPIYMSSANVPTPALHSPTHSNTSPPSRATETTPIDDLIPEEVEPGDIGEMEKTREMESEEIVIDDTVCSNSCTHSITTHGKLNPYGNYGDETITRVAGVAPPPELFDDSKYAEWSPHSDSDDVNSDCQSEYYL